MSTLRTLAALAALLILITAWMATSSRSDEALAVLSVEMAPAPAPATTHSVEHPQPLPPPGLDWRPLDLRVLAVWQGPYWLRWRLSAPAEQHASDYALRLSVGASSRSWWNGQHLQDNGTVGDTAMQERPGRMDVITPLPSRPNSGSNVLVVLASSHHQALSLHNATASVQVAPIAAIVASQTHPWLIAALAIGALGAACLYFFATLSGGPHMPGARLLLVLGAVGLALPVVEAWRPLLGYPYPWHGPRLVLLLVLHLVAAVLLPAYIARRFAVVVPYAAALAYLAAISAAALLLPGFDTRSAAVLLASLLASTWLLLRASGPQEERGPILGLLLAGALALLFAGGAFLDGPYFLLLAVLMSFLLVRHAAQQRSLDLHRAWLQGEHARLSLQLLQRSMQPHWLMNTLTSLQELIEQQPRRASRLVESVADQFHRLREISNMQSVPLEEEIALCRSHLDSIGLALDRPIGFELQLKDHGMTLPPGTLLAQVENALTHAGAAACADNPFRLHVEQAASGRWVLELRSALGTPGRRGQGTGTRYIEASLAATSPARWRFEQGPDGGDWRSRIELCNAS